MPRATGPIVRSKTTTIANCKTAQARNLRVPHGAALGFANDAWRQLSVHYSS